MSPQSAAALSIQDYSYSGSRAEPRRGVEAPSWRCQAEPGYGGEAKVRARSWSGLTAALTELRLDAPFEVHSRLACHRLLVVLDEVGGRFLGRTETPRRPAPDRAHGMFFVPAGTSFWAYADKLRYVRHITFQFAPQNRSDDALPEAARLGFFDARILGLARLFEVECEQDGRETSRFGESLSRTLVALLEDIQPPAAQPAAQGGLTPFQMRLITEHLDAHISQPVCHQTLAQMIGLSPSHFARAFKQTSGLPPHGWLVERRIQRAKEALLGGCEPLAHIALAIGFSDQPHFTRVFSNRVGVSPGVWRRRFAGQVA